MVHRPSPAPPVKGRERVLLSGNVADRTFGQCLLCYREGPMWSGDPTLDWMVSEPQALTSYNMKRPDWEAHSQSGKSGKALTRNAELLNSALEHRKSPRGEGQVLPARTAFTSRGPRWLLPSQPSHGVGQHPSSCVCSRWSTSGRPQRTPLCLHQGVGSACSAQASHVTLARGLPGT